MICHGDDNDLANIFVSWFQFFFFWGTGITSGYQKMVEVVAFDDDDDNEDVLLSGCCYLLIYG